MEKSDKELLREMAFSRDEWKAGVGAKMFGGLAEWYKYQFALRSGLSTDKKNGHLVSHWHNESERLASYDIASVIDADVKFSSSGKRKAFEEQIVRIQAFDNRARTKAKNHVMKCFPGKKIVDLDKNADEDYWTMIRDTFDYVISMK